MNIEIIIFVTWVISGLIAILLMCINDIRGTAYDSDYFDIGWVCVVLMLILFGYLSFLFLIGLLIWRNELVPKMLYKISNIGFKWEDKK